MKGKRNVHERHVRPIEREKKSSTKLLNKEDVMIFRANRRRKNMYVNAEKVFFLFFEQFMLRRIDFFSSGKMLLWTV
jgi:hypothetical protein